MVWDGLIGILWVSPSGKRLHKYGISPWSMEKSTITGHFHSYIKLSEGISIYVFMFGYRYDWWQFEFWENDESMTGAFLNDLTGNWPQQDFQGWFHQFQQNGEQTQHLKQGECRDRENCDVGNHDFSKIFTMVVEKNVFPMYPLGNKKFAIENGYLLSIVNFPHKNCDFP